MRFLHHMSPLVWQATHLSALQRYTITCTIVGVLLATWFYWICQPLAQHRIKLVEEQATYTQHEEQQRSLNTTLAQLRQEVHHLQTNIPTQSFSYQLLFKELIRLLNKAGLTQLHVIPHHQQNSPFSITVQTLGTYTAIATFFDLLAQSDLSLFPNEINIEAHSQDYLQLRTLLTADWKGNSEL
jgi:hypothetical protein